MNHFSIDMMQRSQNHGCTLRRHSSSDPKLKVPPQRTAVILAENYWRAEVACAMAMSIRGTFLGCVRRV
jgi:hypothetical protein